MRLLLFIILSLVWQVYADVLSTENGLPKKHRRTGADFIYPYFDFSIGGLFMSSNHEKESRYNYYYDREKDVMVYDENLHIDLSSFDGFGLDFDFKAGVALFRGFWPVTLIPFVDVAIFHVRGTEEYKYYSLDKEWIRRDYDITPLMFLLGVMVYPFKSEDSPLHGLFVGVAVGSSDRNDNPLEGVEYGRQETILKLELGNVWPVSEHYFVGFAGKALWGFGLDDDAVPVNSKTFGLALKIVRK